MELIQINRERSWPVASPEAPRSSLTSFGPTRRLKPQTTCVLATGLPLESLAGRWGRGSIGREMGDAIESLTRRFPQHASTIRRLQACDPSFRSICDDYAEAQRALKHWEAASPAAPERVAEYRQSLKELEAEALAILDAFEGK